MLWGKLHILDCDWNMLYEQSLPAPTIANIDADSDYELVINTINSGFAAYDLPGSAGARIQWQSGRNRGWKIEQKNTIGPMLFLLLN